MSCQCRTEDELRHRQDEERRRLEDERRRLEAERRKLEEEEKRVRPPVVPRRLNGSSLIDPEF